MEFDDFDPALPAYRPAVYTPDSDPRLRGNPMAEVWPGPRTDFFKALVVRFAKRPAEFLDLTLQERLEWLDRLDEFHYPFSGEVEYMRRVVSGVRKTFHIRNPANPMVLKVLLAAADGRWQALPRLSETGGGGASGILITGITGTGKTSFTDRLQATYLPRPWLHTSVNGRPCRWFQLGGIRVKVKSTWKSTLQAILIAVDFQLRTNYYAKREAGATNGRYESSVLAAATGHFAPYIILDDLDRLRTLKGNHAEEILKGLVDLMEGAGLVVIVVGTVRVRYLFKQFPAYHSKFSSAGHIKFEPIPEGKDFDRYLAALKSQSVSKTPICYARDFDHQLYIRTMGVRRFIREFMRCVMLRHAYEERIVPNAALLDDILDNELEYLKPCLQVLWQVAAGFDAKFLQFQAYEDLVPPERPKLRTEERQALLRWQETEGALTPQRIRETMSPRVYEQIQAARTQAVSDAARAEADAQTRATAVLDDGSGAVSGGHVAASANSPPRRKRAGASGSSKEAAIAVEPDDPSAIR